MWFSLWMTLINTAYWVGLHFLVAFLVTKFHPEPFDEAKPFFVVSGREMNFYRSIRLPYWKDKLPQYNQDFDKRHLQGKDKTYLRLFINQTCRAEVIHDLIALAGFSSLSFSLFCGEGMVWLFLSIALFIALCNLPFSMIQRYNRYRLVALEEKR